MPSPIQACELIPHPYDQMWMYCVKIVKAKFLEVVCCDLGCRVNEGCGPLPPMIANASETRRPVSRVRPRRIIIPVEVLNIGDGMDRVLSGDHCIHCDVLAQVTQDSE